MSGPGGEADGPQQRVSYGRQVPPENSEVEQEKDDDDRPYPESGKAGPVASAGFRGGGSGQPAEPEDDPADPVPRREWLVTSGDWPVASED